MKMVVREAKRAIFELKDEACERLNLSPFLLGAFPNVSMALIGASLAACFELDGSSLEVLLSGFC